MTRAALVVLVLMGLIGCAAGEDPASLRVRSTPLPVETPAPLTPEPTPEPAPQPPAEPATPQPPPPAGLDGVGVRLVQIATLSQPLAVATRDTDPALYVAEKGGVVRAIRDGAADPQPALDLSGEVSGGSEQGLLGLVFSPAGGELYVHFTDTAGNTRVREYRMVGGRADPGSVREVLQVAQPRSNHNGGHLAFGPDGHLYLALGDGGGSGDPEDNGQNLGTLLGSMLRISPLPAGGAQYTVPPDNPFVGRQGARPEIWSYGLRNPWRYSFDRDTGDLWIADVGQNAWEWINYQPSASRGGENYGWNRTEGSHPFRGAPPPGHVPPIYEYRNDRENCAIIGGYVYRGERIPGLRGAYLFADFCAGRLRALRQQDGRTTEHAFLGPGLRQPSAFGQDQAGELYVVSLAGPVYRLEPG